MTKSELSKVASLLGEIVESDHFLVTTYRTTGQDNALEEIETRSCGSADEALSMAQQASGTCAMAIAFHEAEDEAGVKHSAILRAFSGTQH